MESWISRSNPGKQYLVAAASALAGAVLMWGFHDYRLTDTNAMAGFFLGLLLAGLGLAGILAGGRQSVLVDPRTRRIVVEDTNLFGAKQRSIPFKDIAGISIGFLGKRSNHAMWYYLRLELVGGESYPLFAPGRFYEGGSDRAIVMGWEHRLQDYIDRS